MKKIVTGILIGIAVTAFGWWLQSTEAELTWSTTLTRLDPVATVESQFAGTSIYSIKISNIGNETATDITVEISLPNSDLITANLDVPEQASIRSWSTTDSLNNSKSLISLQYNRLLPSDNIQIGAIARNLENDPEIIVRSNEVVGVNQDIIERNKQQLADTMEIVLLIFMTLGPIFLLIIINKSKKARRAIINTVIPIYWLFNPILKLVAGKNVYKTLQGRHLINSKNYEKAIKLLDGSEDAYDQYLLAQCHSALENENELRVALNNWLNKLFKEYIEEKSIFDFLRKTNDNEKIRKRLTETIQ